jgi:MoxR-like ATPase
MADISSRTVSPSGAKKSLRKAFKNKRPIFMWGPPGIGKSDIIKQLGVELDAHVIDVRLSLWEPH